MIESLTTIIARAGALSLRDIISRAGSGASYQLADLIKSGALQLTPMPDDAAGGFFGNLKAFGRKTATTSVDDLVAEILDGGRTPTAQFAEQLKHAAAAPEADLIEVIPTTKGWRGPISVG